MKLHPQIVDFSGYSPGWDPPALFCSVLLEDGTEWNFIHDSIKGWVQLEKDDEGRPTVEYQAF